MTDPQNLLPGLHEAMRLLKQNDLDYGPGRILDRIKELGGPREFWVALPKDGGASVAVYTMPPIKDDRFNIIHCREVCDVR